MKHPDPDVEFYSKNKFKKLVHLVGFSIRMERHMYGYKIQNIQHGYGANVYT
jgi:hypothetical protein